jgi:small subunit ribosomal protein S17
MADDEKKNETEETEAPAVEAEATEAAPEVPAEPEAEATPEPEAAAEATPEPEAAAPPTPAAPAAEPVPEVSPKERRQARRRRSRGSEDAAEPVTLEQRIERRAAERKRKAAARTRRRAGEKTKRDDTRKAAPAAEPTPPREHGPGRPKVRQGLVVSDKADKTITVRIDAARRHRRYEKIIRSTSTLHAHDERNDAHEGDTVRVVECRPMSRNKRWRLEEVLERAK